MQEILPNDVLPESKPVVSTFHSLLEQLTRQLEIAHDLEVAALQSQLKGAGVVLQVWDTPVERYGPDREDANGESRTAEYLERPTTKQGLLESSSHLDRASLDRAQSTLSGGYFTVPAVTMMLCDHEGKDAHEDNDDDSNDIPMKNLSSMVSISTSAPVTSTKRVVESTIYNLMQRHVNDLPAVKPRDSNLLQRVEIAATIVIILNSMTIGLSVDVYPTWKGWFVADALFAACFVAELCIKVCILGFRGCFCGPGAAWNCFDVVLTGSAVAEVGIAVILFASPDEEITKKVNMSFLRATRLMRVAKISRLARLHWLTELMMILNGALGGAKIFVWSLVVLCVPLYMVSLVLTALIGQWSSDQFEEKVGAKEFGSIPKSFFTVFRCVVSSDCTDEIGNSIPLMITRSFGWPYAVVYCFTTALFTFGLFNILTAIYVESVVDSAKRNDALHKARRMADTDNLTTKMQSLMLIIARHVGEDHTADDADDRASAIRRIADLMIDPDLFDQLCHDPDFQLILSTLGIAAEDRIDLFDTLDVEGRGKIDIHNMVMGIAKLRGSPRRSDMVNLSLVARSIQADQRKFERAMQKQLQLVLDQLKSLQDRQRFGLSPLLVGNSPVRQVSPKIGIFVQL